MIARLWQAHQSRILCSHSQVVVGLKLLYATRYVNAVPLQCQFCWLNLHPALYSSDFRLCSNRCLAGCDQRSRWQGPHSVGACDLVERLIHCRCRVDDHLPAAIISSKLTGVLGLAMTSQAQLIGEEVLVRSDLASGLTDSRRPKEMEVLQKSRLRMEFQPCMGELMLLWIRQPSVASEIVLTCSVTRYWSSHILNLYQKIIISESVLKGKKEEDSCA